MSIQNFDGRVALVTGATSGIGLASATALAEHGAKVVLAGRREDKGEAAAANLRDAGHEAFFIKTDVSKPAEVEALVGTTVERYGGLDIAFNNAGLEGDAFVPTHESTLENYDKLFDVNVRGVFTSMKAELGAMLAKGNGGAIINNASVAGMIGFGGMTLYTATKHAVVGLTRGASVEYAPAGIRINAVAPGPIETEMYDRFAGDETVAEQIKTMVPAARTGTAAEIASAVLWLADPANSYTLGTVLPIDGGFTAQ